MKFRRSLLVKYLGVIALYIAIAPILFVVIVIAYNVYTADMEEVYEPKYSTREIEETWHQSAQGMDRFSDREKVEKLTELKQKYPESTLFWVDEQGELRFKQPEEATVPQFWSPAMIVQFMKESVGADPFTVVALLGEEKENGEEPSNGIQQDRSGQDEVTRKVEGIRTDNGFMVIQMPREYTQPSRPNDSGWWFGWLSFIVLVGLFIFLSWLFFNRIRRRLLNLQQVMKEAQDTGDFRTVPVSKQDEIGDLEYSFNRMAVRLQESREREQKEEQLRRELMANLSHDLRTPLTVLRGQTYTLKEEQLSEQGKQSLTVIDDKIHYLGQLIDNLLSFSLLSAGKYPYDPQRTDVVGLVRAIAASWYPVLEKEGFEVDVNLPEQAIYWEVDPQWFQRIWDNLFQNVVRYAQEGKYVGLHLQTNDRGTCLLLKDRGPGLNRPSAAKGAGIGLSIVSLMATEMDLDWHMESSQHGTHCFLCKSSASTV